MKLRIGTSGFQYPEWKGKFYPETMPPAKMLPFYAEHFATTEINYTFRRIPSVATLEKWSLATPPHFSFALKAPQKITHWSKLRDCAETTEVFLAVTKLLGVKRGPILFQLPPNFCRDVAVLADFLSTLPTDVQAAFEFRHESWFDDKVFALLQRHNAALCVAESDDFATPLVSTANFGYLRLRRTEYSTRDISTWAKRIAAQGKEWKETFIYFKHEDTGTGPIFAKKLQAKFV